MDIEAKVVLNNGVEIPLLGFGTYKIEPGEMTYNAVRNALEVGYRHIDTAKYYRNEESVGKAVRESGVPREEVFVTTKLWNSDQGYESALKAFEESLDRLGLEYIDLYLIHWPVQDMYLDTWRALEDILQSGEVRAIGVSNFMIDHMENLLENSTIIPVVDQVEFHPHLVNLDLLEYCRGKGIKMEAWSPLKKGAMAVDRGMAGIGWRYGKSAAQATLRWDLQHGVVAIPKTVRRERMEENADIFNFELTPAEMRTIDSMDRGQRVGPDPNKVDF